MRSIPYRGGDFPISAGLLVLAGLLLFPWYIQGGGWSALIALNGDENGASALPLALSHGRWWFWPVILTALLPALLLVQPTKPTRARILIASGAALLVAITLQAWLIGLRGWSYPWLIDAFGNLGQRQFGVGLGAVCAFTGAMLLLSSGLALAGYFGGDRFVATAVALLAASILLFTVWPVGVLMAQIFQPLESMSIAVSLADRLFTGKVWGLGCVTGASAQCGVIWNTVALALSTASACTLLGLCFALIVTRTGFRYKRLMRALTILPIITPSFVVGLGLILIFGRSGLINQGLQDLFGISGGRWIYGFNGVWLAQVFSFTPTAFLVLIGVVEGLSPSMEEAAQTLRARPGRIFGTVTFPLMLPGLANAFLVTFIESLADFGNPILLGGSFGVLSTEIYFAVVGAQADFGRAASLAMLLLLLALGAFFLQRAVLGRKSYVSLSGKGDAGLQQPLPSAVRIFVFAVAIPWSMLTASVYLLALAGGFVKVWGRDWSFTLSHFGRALAIEWAPDGSIVWAGGAWNSLFTTVGLAAVAAPITAAIGILAAWLFTRQNFVGRSVLEFALMLTFCVPGTVIGVAYILTYNVPPIEITGTATILVLCFVFRNMPVGVRSGMAAFSQIDRSLDEASAMLGANSRRTLFRIVLPLVRPAILTALVYSFVRAMTTVSAVIFLVSADYEMATVYIINRSVNGDYGLAIAYCTVLIVLMLIAVTAIQLAVGQRRVGRRTESAAGGQSARSLT